MSGPPATDLSSATDRPSAKDLSAEALSAETPAAGRSGRLSVVVAAGGVAMLAFAGLLLWAGESEALFFASLAGALAGCF